MGLGLGFGVGVRARVLEGETYSVAPFNEAVAAQCGLFFLAAAW